MPAPSAWLLRNAGYKVGDFVANFSATEDPISDGGKYFTGKSTGLDWNDPATDGTKAYADINSGISGQAYDDSIAILKPSYRTFSANQFAQGTVYLASGYTGNGGSHEIELLLRGTASANSWTMYEIGWGIAGYLFVVRWDGPVAGFTAIYDPGLGSIPTPNDGDVLYAQISGNIITVKLNGSIVANFGSIDITSVAGSVWASGNPGFGFWPSGAAPDKTKYGWKAYRAGDL